jgi:hypothetical protein
VVLNRDKRVGPSAGVIKRILSSPKTYSFIPNVPPAVQRKVEEYTFRKGSTAYMDIAFQRRAFSNQFDAPPTAISNS